MKAGAALLNILRSHKTRARCLGNCRTNSGLTGRLVRRRRRSRWHSLAIASLSVMKIALRPLLAIASDVGSTGSIRVLGSGTRGTISPTLSPSLLGTRPLISLDLFFRGQLAMSERTLVCLGTLSLGELKARSGAR